MQMVFNMYLISIFSWDREEDIIYDTRIDSDTTGTASKFWVCLFLHTLKLGFSSTIFGVFRLLMFLVIGQISYFG